MTLLCDLAELRGKKPAQIWCKVTGMPCAHTRYCAVSMKYYQTDAAMKCRNKEK